MAKWTIDELEAALAEVARRSSVDPDFRALALKDGASAIAQVAGKAAPDDQKFRFVDNSGKEKVIPLPDPVPDLEELSEAELAAIAGGANDGSKPSKYQINITGTTGGGGGKPPTYGVGVTAIWTKG
jgi:hypothetical protein